MIFNGEILFYVGIALFGISVIGGAVFALCSALGGRRLRAQLEREYGEKKRS